MWFIDSLFIFAVEKVCKRGTSCSTYFKSFSGKTEKSILGKFFNDFFFLLCFLFPIRRSSAVDVDDDNDGVYAYLFFFSSFRFPVPFRLSIILPRILLSGRFSYSKTPFKAFYHIGRGNWNRQFTKSNLKRLFFWAEVLIFFS